MNDERLSAAFCGGAFGDEGKGRIVDEYVNKYLRSGKKVVVYRDNGGANAGHTLELDDGRRIAMHLLPSGILCPEATVVLGKGMVIHPGDLLTEIKEVREVTNIKGTARILIDEMATLSLDTHRAYESALKGRQDGGKGATGRGIAPAYADILLRHPLTMRNLMDFDEAKIRSHYRLYEALLNGLGFDLKRVTVPAYGLQQSIEVGSEDEFVRRLEQQIGLLRPFVADVTEFLRNNWPDSNNAFIFEKAQAIGLDHRWGVYPDVTASDTTFEGIFAATEGVIDPMDIKVRAAVIKATYMSSVGTRKLPTEMEEGFANRIREDAREYGATTKRPRGIAYIDLPALRYFTRVSRTNCHVLTHMDVVYPDTPIRVCTAYTIDGGKPSDYRPDQEHLLKVRPVWTELPTWDRQEIQKAKSADELPVNAGRYIEFLADNLNSRVTMITTGPRRDQSVRIEDD